MNVRVLFISLPSSSSSPSKKKGPMCKKELTVVLALALAPGRDALFEATAFLNPPTTIFDVTSDARFIAAETAGLVCDPLDRFAKISGRDWKYLFKKKTRNNYNLSLTSRGGGGNTKTVLFIHIKGLTHLIKKKRPLSHVLADSKTPSPIMSSSMSRWL